MGKLREAIGERETGLFITTRIQQFEEKQQEKTGKIRQFARCLFICLFQLYLG